MGIELNAKTGVFHHEGGSEVEGVMKCGHGLPSGRRFVGGPGPGCGLVLSASGHDSYSGRSGRQGG